MLVKFFSEPIVIIFLAGMIPALVICLIDTFKK